jgi:outer membrane lipoprotein-sorting protein
MMPGDQDMRIAMRLAVAVVVLVAANTAWAQTAEEVIDKSLAALGGRAAHAKIKTRSMAGTITLGTPAGDIPGTIEITNALPNKARTLIKADLTSLGAGPLVIDQRFDGQSGFVLDTLQGNREITGNQLDNLRNSGFPHAFLTYKELGFTATLQGKEKVGDRDAYVLVFEPTAGSTIRQYIDAESLLPTRFVMTVDVPQMGDLEQTTDLTDYREVDGVKLPFKLTASSSLQSYTVELSKVEHNTAVDEKLFAKP